MNARRLKWRLAVWLAEPKGQLQLIAVTFAVAILMAIGLATQRSFFERYVREKYPPVLGETERLALDIETGKVPAEALETRSCEALYGLWMQTSDAGAYRRLPSVISRGCPSAVNLRLERTFVAGTVAQRRRAAELLAAARDPALRGGLELGLRRARALDDRELLSLLDAIVFGP